MHTSAEIVSSPLSDLRDHLLDRFPGMIRQIVLYGSRVRDDAGRDADMDVLVVLVNCDPTVLEEIRATRYEVMQRHQFHPLVSMLLLSERDWKDLSRQSAGLKHNIEREGIMIWPTT